MDIRAMGNTCIKVAMVSLLIFHFALILFGCGVKMREVGNTILPNGSVKVFWTAPILNVDGSELTDRAGFRIYYSQTSGSYDNILDVANNISGVIGPIDEGRWYIVVTCYDLSGNESNYSDEIFVDVVN